MLKGKIGRLYWGRCLVRSHMGRKVYGFREPEFSGVCAFGYFIEWHR